MAEPRITSRSAIGVEGGVTIDDEEIEKAAEGQDSPDARKLALEKRARFVGRDVRDMSHVLRQHLGKGDVTTDDERGCRPARLVLVDVNGADQAICHECDGGTDPQRSPADIGLAGQQAAEADEGRRPSARTPRRGQGESDLREGSDPACPPAPTPVGVIDVRGERARA